MSGVKILTQQVTWYWRQLLGCVTLSLATIASSTALMACSGWLITKAATHPSIADIAVVIVGVRFFGLSRAALRYAERLVSHNVTLRAIARLRVQLIKQLGNSASTPLLENSSTQLVGRIVHDVDTLNDFLLRSVLRILLYL